MPLNPLAGATRLLRRSADESLSVAALLASGALGAQLPHRYLRALRGLYSYGTYGLLVAAGAQLHGEATALVDEQASLTFRELDEHSNALANAWLAAGVASGDGIGILCRNHRWLFVSLAAAAKVGARTLLLNTDFAPAALRDVCVREDVALLVHDAEFAGAVRGIEPRFGCVIAWGTESAVADAVAGGDRSAPHRPAAQSRLVLLTSGTTGTPKGAPRDLAMSLVAPGGFLSKIPFRTRRNAFVAAPVFHAWGLLSSSMALAVGDTVIVRRRFDPVVTLDAIAEHRCDVLAMVPVMLSRLLALGADEIALRDTSALRIICLSGSAVAPDLVARTREVFGDVLYNLYGSTEVSFATIATPDDLREEPACVGRAPFGVTVRLFDAHGRPVRPGEVGRIFVGSGFQSTGYTGGGGKEVIDGLLSSGDVGHFDRHGRLFIDGRDDDMIISGGENVFPAEIEHLLGSHEGIVEAAVIGVADPEFGQRLRAYVVASPGSRLDEDAVRTFVRDNLARHKVPREVVFADALPRNPTGKVLKRELP